MNPRHRMPGTHFVCGQGYWSIYQALQAAATLASRLLNAKREQGAPVTPRLLRDCTVPVLRGDGSLAATAKPRP